MPAVSVVAGNALGFGGAARNHTMMELKNFDFTKNHNSQLTTDLQDALVFQANGKTYALKAGFSNNGVAQEESLYHKFLYDFPIKDNQAFWNKTLANFVKEKCNSIANTQGIKNKNGTPVNILGNLCKLEAINYQTNNQFEQIVANNRDNLNKIFAIHSKRQHSCTFIRTAVFTKYTKPHWNGINV